MRERDRILRAVALALLLYALGSYTGARWELARQQERTKLLEARRSALQSEERSLEERLRQAEDPEQMRRLAWERLRMVRPEETVFAFSQTR